MMETVTAMVLGAAVGAVVGSWFMLYQAKSVIRELEVYYETKHSKKSQRHH